MMDIVAKVRRVRGSAVLAAMLAASSHASSARPYEMEWANRTTDIRTPVYPMTDVDGWTVHARDSVASLSRSTEHLLFGDGVLRLTYRAAGDNPEIRLRPPAPYVLPPGTDAIQLWIYGNISPAFSPKRVKDTPVTHVYADFLDSEDKRFTVTLSHNNFKEWFIGSHRFNAREKARTAAGGRFVELVVNGGKNVEDRHIEFNSLCIFKEELKPLKFKERPQRGVKVFADQGQGINTGEGRLPFPTVDTTIVPAPDSECPDLEFRFPKDSMRWDDLAFRWRKGEWIRVAVGGGVFPATNVSVRADFKRIGCSVVCDLVAKGGAVEEVRFGSVEGLPEARHIPVPYYTFKKWKGLAGRPGVVAGRVGGMPFFIGENFDWTQSNASDVFGPDLPKEGRVAANGGVKYIPKTDGRRNDCYERFVWSFSTNFADVLPEIPNPVSPWKAETARRTWIAHGVHDRASDLKTWRARHRMGLRDMIVTDHEGQWRDGYESFTYRTRTAPGKGGDKGQYDYTRAMIDELGYMYGPYNCYCELAPVNGHWSEDVTARTSGGDLLVGWERCFVPKPVWQPTACEAIVPKTQAKFRFNTAYCDVHTCVTPWTQVDFDARVPGAGTFSQTFYSYGEVMLQQRRFWGGPVYSEGAAHWLYCGLTDGNYAQDPEYGISKNPWLLDFDLIRLHPKCVNFGMGAKPMFYGSAEQPSGAAADDRFIAATIAFGHSPFLIWAGGLWRGTFMVVGASSRYCVADAIGIRYGDSHGRLLNTSEAVLDGAYMRSQVAVEYSDGTSVFVNGNAEEAFAVKAGRNGVSLPPNGWFVRGEGVLSVSAMKDGHRVDCAIAPGYVYFDGRKKWTAFPCGSSDGAVLRRMLGGNDEEVLLFRASKVALPFEAAAVHALAESGEDLGPDAEAKAVGGVTVLVPRKGVYSWRVTRPAGWKEPLDACASIWDR